MDLFTTMQTVKKGNSTLQATANGPNGLTAPNAQPLVTEGR